MTRSTTQEKQHSQAQGVALEVVARLVVEVKLEWSCARSPEESSGFGVGLLYSFLALYFILYSTLFSNTSLLCSSS